MIKGENIYKSNDFINYCLDNSIKIQYAPAHESHSNGVVEVCKKGRAMFFTLVYQNNYGQKLYDILFIQSDYYIWK